MPSTVHARRTRRSILPVIVGLIGGFGLTIPARAVADTSPGMLQVSVGPFGSSISGQGFDVADADQPFVVEFDDADTSDAPDATWTVPADFPDGGADAWDTGFWLSAPFDDGSHTLEAGDHVRVNHGSSDRKLTLATLEFTGLDLVAGTVSGSTDPNTNLYVTEGNPEQWRTDQRMVSMTADDAGVWTAHFGPSGGLLAGDAGGIAVPDTDGDETVLMWGAPFVAAGIDVDGPDSADDPIWGGFWYLDEQLDVTITDAYGNAKHEFLGVDVDKTWWNGFGLEGQQPTDLIVGDLVHVHGVQSGIDVTHSIVHLAVDGWEAAGAEGDGNRLWGTAVPVEPFTFVHVEVHDDLGTRYADVVGNSWEVDFDDPPAADGSEYGHEIFVGPGVAGRVELRGPDGNLTFGVWGDLGGGFEDDPVIQAHVTEEFFQGSGWTPESTVSVSLYANETAYAGGVALAPFDPMELPVDGGGWFWTEVHELEQGLQPGMVLVATDGDVTKTLVISDVRFDSFDPTTNVVAGTIEQTPPLGELWLHLSDRDGAPMADGTGHPIAFGATQGDWFFDLDDHLPFDAPNYDPDGLTEARVEVPDSGDTEPGTFDGDGTFAQLPQVFAFPYLGFITSSEFDSDTSVSVTVLRDDAEIWGPAAVDVSPRGEFGVEPESGLQPDDAIRVVGNVTGIEKVLVVEDATIELIDTATDRVSGTASVAATIKVQAGNEFCGIELITRADGSGIWTAEFGNQPGCETEWFDLTDDMGVSVEVFDPDMDRTFVQPAEPPAFVADPMRERVRAFSFPSGAELQLTVRDGPDGDVLLGPIAATAQGYETVFDLMQLEQWLDLAPGDQRWFDLRPGHVITLDVVDDASLGKQLTVAELGIDLVDDQRDEIDGFTDPGVDLFMFVQTDSGGVEYVLQADPVDGTWTVVLGDTEGDAPDIDKTVPWFLFMGVPDDDGDATIYESPQATPGTIAFPALDVISAEGSGFGPVTIGVFDEDGTSLHTSSGAVDHGRDRIFGEVELDVLAADTEVYTYERRVDLAGVLDLEPEMIVTSSDVLWDMTFTVQHLTVDAADTAESTLQGTVEHPGLVGTFVSGSVGFGFVFEQAPEWTMPLYRLNAEPLERYHLAGTDFGVTFASDAVDQPFDTYTGLMWDLRPHIATIEVPIDPVEVDVAVEMSAEFTDLDAAFDTHTAEVHWGDAAVAMLDGVDNSFAASHRYTDPGIYTVQVTVTDAAGQSDTAESGYVVVYDPGAGFVTGGGWIESPPGAYTADPDLAGDAHFGFVAKYQKGAKVPKGSTNFQFQAAGLHFQSTAYDWLVVTGGDRAKFKGEGTINGLGEYGFMVTAVDDPNGDTFRIKIWDAATDAAVYDNQPGAAVDASDGTALEGGSIVVHRGR